MKGGCKEHSKGLQLISLKTRLEKEELNPAEKWEILQLVKRLEKELKLD